MSQQNVPSPPRPPRPESGQGAIFEVASQLLQICAYDDWGGLTGGLLETAIQEMLRDWGASFASADNRGPRKDHATSCYLSMLVRQKGGGVGVEWS